MFDDAKVPSDISVKGVGYNCPYRANPSPKLQNAHTWRTHGAKATHKQWMVAECKARMDPKASKLTQHSAVLSSAPTRNCQCGDVARTLTVQRDTVNKGRKFWNCANNRCGFFAWHDEVKRPAPPPAPQTDGLEQLESSLMQLSAQADNAWNDVGTEQCSASLRALSAAVAAVALPLGRATSGDDAKRLRDCAKCAVLAGSQDDDTATRSAIDAVSCAIQIAYEQLRPPDSRDAQTSRRHKGARAGSQ